MKGDHRQTCSYKSNIEGMLVQKFTDLVTQGSCALRESRTGVRLGSHFRGTQHRR